MKERKALAAKCLRSLQFFFLCFFFAVFFLSSFFSDKKWSVVWQNNPTRQVEIVLFPFPLSGWKPICCQSKTVSHFHCVAQRCNQGIAINKAVFSSPLHLRRKNCGARCKCRTTKREKFVAYVMPLHLLVLPVGVILFLMALLQPALWFLRFVAISKDSSEHFIPIFVLQKLEGNRCK